MSTEINFSKKISQPFSGNDSCTFHECREGKGVCWKTILMAYGVNNWTFPDPMCPKAPEPHRKYWLE